MSMFSSRKLNKFKKKKEKKNSLPERKINEIRFLNNKMMNRICIWKTTDRENQKK